MTTDNSEGIDVKIGLTHRHDLEEVRTLRGLQSAHKWMDWNVTRSRILSVKACSTCGEHALESVQQCAASNCQSHWICRRPYG